MLSILVVEVSFTYFQELIITQSTVSLKTRFLNRTISIKNFSKWVVKVITQEDSTQTPVYQWVTMEMEEKSIRLVRYEKKFDNFVESYLQTLLEYGLILSEETKQNLSLCK